MSYTTFLFVRNHGLSREVLPHGIIYNVRFSSSRDGIEEIFNEVTRCNGQLRGDKSEIVGMLDIESDLDILARIYFSKICRGAEKDGEMDILPKIRACARKLPSHPLADRVRQYTAERRQLKYNDCSRLDDLNRRFTDVIAYLEQVGRGKDGWQWR